MPKTNEIINVLHGGSEGYEACVFDFDSNITIDQPIVSAAFANGDLELSTSVSSLETRVLGETEILGDGIRRKRFKSLVENLDYAGGNH